MKLLMAGDVVGGPGRKIFAREVKKLKSSHAIDACIVNGENAAAGSGITSALAKELFDAGADAITLGDHTWGQKEFAGQIGGIENLVRPCNFAKECPGKGWTLVTMPTFRPDRLAASAQLSTRLPSASMPTKPFFVLTPQAMAVAAAAESVTSDEAE